MEMIIYRKGVPHTVLYDEDLYHIVIQYAWNISRAGYVVGRKKGFWKEPQQLMHRVLLGIEKGSPEIFDHKNRNKIDNRRQNLRSCTHSENQKNRAGTGRSKYMGVAFHRTPKRDGTGEYYGLKSRAIITIDGKSKHLGYFKTEEEAAHAYDDMARIHHGEFAFLNFPDQ